MSRVRVTALGAALLVALAAPVVAQTRRPTPHEALDRAMAPVQAAVQELSPTEEERARLAEILARAEATAAELVAAEHRRLPDVANARRQRIELLARSVRSRVEALRAEAAAEREERRAMDAEARLTVARGALERAAERRVSAERGEAVSTRRLPPPEAVSDAGAAVTDGGAP